MPADSYKTLLTSLRPPRVACLIDSSDQNWKPSILTALEAFTRTWGGGGFIIIPTDGKTISNPFWQILLSYDPDYLWIARMSENNRGELILSDELVNKLKLRLAPFHHDDSVLSEQDKRYGLLQNLITEGSTYPKFRAEPPFTDLTKFPESIQLSNLVQISNLDEKVKLWVGSVTGIVSKVYEDDFKNQIQFTPINFDDAQAQVFETVFNGIRQIHKNLIDDNSSLPFAASLAHCGFYRSLKFPVWKESTLIVVGDTLEDFCLYFCLSRMRDRVSWLIPGWIDESINNIGELEIYQDNYLSHFVRSFRKRVRETQNESTAHIVSYNSFARSATDLLKTALTEVRFGSDLVFESQKITPVISKDQDQQITLESLLTYPLRIYEFGNADKISSRHFIGKQMAGFFDTPKPKSFQIVNRDLYWVTDFKILNEQYPRHPHLGVKIVQDGLLFHTHARVGKDSIAFVDPRSGFINNDVDSWLRKPAIVLLTAFEIYRLLFQKLGYEVEISDKGRFGLAAIGKFGSLPSFANFLLANGKREALESYIKPKAVKSGASSVPARSIFLSSDNRWYLDFSVFKEILRDDISASTLIYYLVQISVLHRGLVLKCELCRGTDWYGITELTQEFKCKRCSFQQFYGRFHALSKFEPQWYYKLDELVYKALTQNCIVPILALNYLREKSETFDFSPELELLDPITGKQLLELDICCIADGQLIIGEAKSNDRLGGNHKEENRTIEKYYELAEHLGASVVVFATTSEQWREVTREKILNYFSNSLIKVQLLTKKDLLKPPQF